MRQAVLRADNGSSSSSTGESTRLGGDFWRLLFGELVDVGLAALSFAADAVFVGDTTLTGDEPFVCGADLGVDADFEVPILGDGGF